MNIGLGIGIPFNRSQIWLSLFSPGSLFANNEQGVWYDPSDIKLNWRRNLLAYTEQFDNGVWSKGGSTISANSGVSPDGTLTADLLVETTATGDHYVVESQAVSWASGSQVTGSVFVKPK